MTDWQYPAAELARTITHPASGWYRPVRLVPRHLFVPRWFTSGTDGWAVTDGPADQKEWFAAVYDDRTLVTRVGALHADHADAGTTATGRPTSSSTHPALVVQMLRHGRLTTGARLLDVATGSGYSAALAAHRFGDQNVTSIDVDPYLTHAARDRLDSIGLHPEVITCDATGELPGDFDRIVSMVSMPRIPASWLAALRPGGRLVTTIAETGLIITADKQPDGSAVGRVEWDRAAFMATRAGDDYPSMLDDLFATVLDQDGDQVRESPFPAVNVMGAWELWSLMTLTVPRIEHRIRQGSDGTLTAWMLHPDGSWARASSAAGATTAIVHQAGPRRLWDELDRFRWWWLRDGSLPVYGARVEITSDGTTTFSRSGWTATL
ncbi:methyltransferase domain-containing protein [Kitasatospora kifunensis]|uniref:Protein-L-isoaspartate O-methyltransferase n=1 Tax=Kitasatospora kifunensis TaxID=58351 RepID=A0A7W7R957_KITKI|nr:methyltransferase domain-containing protein [Kitasatospora kifunensis]MBB4927742.1 protein-L-isoaspartate O-methyltransferase [Kitasatospora kifunensis]